MAKLIDVKSTGVVKMILMGANGAGKTGALASLADAGYNLRIIDLDSGTKVLRTLLTDARSPYKNREEAIGRIEVEPLSDPMKNINGKLVPKAATVWQRTAKLLDNWKTESADFGPVSSWTDKDVLVIDSMTSLARGAMDFVLSMNARLGQQPHQSDWYAGQQLVESLLRMITDDGVHCNVILICHVLWLGDDNGPQIGYPETLGKKLSPKVGTHFNTMLLARSTGSGAGQKRQIHTRSQIGIELKTAAPLAVKDAYPIETGLADFFKDERAQ